MAIPLPVVLLLMAGQGLASSCSQNCADENSDEVSLLTVNTQIHKRWNMGGALAYNTQFGSSTCPCVGVSGFRGIREMLVEKTEYNYSLSVGSECETWDATADAACRGPNPAAYCSEKWCYVDPCNCKLSVPPKKTLAKATYLGEPAYWSYKTCGSVDKFSSTIKDACVNSKDSVSCAKNPKCSWDKDGEFCGAKAPVKTCKLELKASESQFGSDDCRCVGMEFSPRSSFMMYINKTTREKYPGDVGGSCKAWEKNVHPACLVTDGKPPSWCDQKWCWVDPCKCSIAVPPKPTMEQNQDMGLNYHGKVLYWSYATCGGKDSWSSSGAAEYCAAKKDKHACSKLNKCTWEGSSCIEKKFAEMCALETENPGATANLAAKRIKSGAVHATPFMALLATASVLLRA